VDIYNKPSSTELYHYGVKGMKWGVRRYQNADGSLTSAGRRRYQKDEFILGPNVRDAVGIHPSVAERLSGADFDGDQVVVIPTGGRVNVKSTPALEGLRTFDAKVEYSTEGKTGIRLLSKEATQIEMGKISNLITDMTLKGAPDSDIIKAVKHSMVVIDAAKHKLDYKRSEQENDIATLRKKWQGYVDEDGKEHGGASTLLSRRKQTVEVPERQGSGRIDRETGEMVYKESGRT